MRQDPERQNHRIEKLNVQESNEGNIQFYSSLNIAECIESSYWVDLKENL